MNHSKSKGRTNNSGQRTKFYLEQFDPEASKKLKILIAKFLDKKGVIPWQDAEGQWISPADLMLVDRTALAKQFVSSRLKVSTIEELEAQGFRLSSPLSFDAFLLEVEKHMDLRIPCHYYIHRHSSKGTRATVKKRYPGVDCFPGLGFKYRVNYILDLRYADKLKVQREADQLKQLKFLACKQGMTLKRHVLNAQEVSELLDAFAHQRISETQLKTYFYQVDPYQSQAKLTFDELYA